MKIRKSKMKRMTAILLATILTASVFEMPGVPAYAAEQDDLQAEEELSDDVLQEEDSSDPDLSQNIWNANWQVEDDKALAIIDSPATEEAADPATLCIYAEHEQDMEEVSDGDVYDQSEALYEDEISISEIRSNGYELPVEELEPGDYVLSINVDSVEAFRDSFSVVIYSSGSEEDELYVSENVFYVPSVHDDANTEENAEEDEDAENVTENDAENIPAEEEDLITDDPENAAEPDDEKDAAPGILSEEKETDTTAEEAVEDGETDEFASKPTALSIYLKNDPTDNYLYVDMGGASDAEATVVFVICDSNDYYSGSKYYIAKGVCKKGETKALSIAGSAFSNKAPAGIWHIFAAELNENEDYDDPVLISENCVTCFVPRTPDPTSIEPATSGLSDGGFRFLTEKKYAEIDSTKGIPGNIIYGRADADENTYQTASADAQINGLAAGTYRVKFDAARLLDNSWFAAASDYTSFVIPEKEIKVNKIQFIGDGGPINNLLMYKGQTKMLSLLFNEGQLNQQPADNSVTFTSSDPSAVAVDAAGNITAKKVTASPVTITATSNDGSGKSAALAVSVHAPLKIKTAKAAVSAAWGSQVTLEFTVTPTSSISELGWNINNFDVTSTDESVWEVPPIKSSFMTFDSATGKGSITIYPTNSIVPGKTVITVIDDMGDLAACELSLDGVYQPGTPNMMVVKGGIKQTGWIYLDAANQLTTKNKAVTTYYIDPVSGKPAKQNGILKIGKELFAFHGYKLYTDVVNVAIDNFHGKAVYFGEGGKLKTGWQNDRYYDPETGIMTVSSFVPYSGGTAWVGENGQRVESGFKTIDSIMYYFEKGKIKTGWIYVDASNMPVAKAKASKWYYADPNNGFVLRSNAVCTIGNKKYYVFTDGHIHNQPGLIDLNNDSKVGDHDYIAGNDGSILINKLYTHADGRKYYLGEDGHPRTGMFIYGGKVVNTDETGAWIDTCNDKMFICDLRNNGSVKAYGISVNGNMQFYSDASHTVLLKNAWIRTKNYNNRNMADYCYLDKNGKMVRGFQNIDGRRYFFDESTGFLEVGEREGSGAFKSGTLLVDIKGKKYLLNNKLETFGDQFPGRIFYNQAGIQTVGTKKYFIDANGACQSGWKTVGGKKYYFIPNAWEMTTEDVPLNGKRYSIEKSDGSLSPEGPRVEFGKFVGYIQKDGTYKIGWIYLYQKDGKWELARNAATAEKVYYTGAGGFTIEYSSSMECLYLIGGRYYAINSDNSMAKGWKQLKNPAVVDYDNRRLLGTYTGSFLFYFDPETCAAVTGLKSLYSYPQFKNGELILNSDNSFRVANSEQPVKMIFAEGQYPGYPAGALLLNGNFSVSGTIYSIGKDGKILSGTGFVDLERTQYRYADGTIASGRTKIGNTFYYFDPVDGTVQKDCLRLSGKKWYRYDSIGKQVQNPDFATVPGDPKVTAVYASDGSISSFKYVSNDKKAQNVGFIVGSETLIIGKNGLPSTGLVSHTSGSYYYEADGKPYFTGGKNALIKIGKKYYLCNDGKMCSGENEIEGIDGSLSGSEIENTKLLWDLHTYATPETFNCYTGEDGSVISGGLVSGVHTGTFGTRVDNPEKVLFYKYGGKWYVPGQNGFGEKNVTLMAEPDMEYVNVCIRWKQGGVLQGVYGMDGKPLNGLFSYLVGSSRLIVFFKNGVPQTGKQTIDLSGILKFGMEFDNDCGLGYTSLAM
ncbi:MAG: Ig-like domain-containing protein [Lachnospiraceae bacterium]|nr:Ig-like domain-containing protein [Lachnospiraceae bacterium]